MDNFLLSLILLKSRTLSYGVWRYSLNMIVAAVSVASKILKDGVANGFEFEVILLLEWFPTKTKDIVHM